MRERGADGIGILKLDIEGGEHALLSRNRTWIGRTDAICIELHDGITEGRINSKMKGEKYLSIASQEALLRAARVVNGLRDDPLIIASSCAAAPNIATAAD
jgi:hypothetical protein